jgi:hypothetical protein
LYLFPPSLRGSPLANTGLHVSHHASGESQVTVQEFPISCLGFKPKIRLSFSREEFIADIITKKQSLFSDINLTAEQKAGTILVLKSEVVTNFINTTFKNWLEDPRYIDYYNLVKTNHYRPTSDFRESFPYKGIEIDAQQIEQAIKTYTGDNLYELYMCLRKNKSIEDADMVYLVPDNQTSIIVMSGTGKGLRIDLNNIENTICKLPGAYPLFDTLRKLMT